MLINHSMEEGKDPKRKARKQVGKANLVVLGENTLVRLRALREMTDGTGYVFTREDGRPFMYDTVLRFIKSCEAQVEGWPEGLAPIHALRHAAGTKMLADGLTVAEIADRLGDTVNTVSTTYVQATVEGREKAAKATDYAI